MDHAGSQLPWSEEQWTKVQSAVTEAFRRTNVAGVFLPCFEPEAASAEAIRTDQLVIGPGNAPLEVRDQLTRPLFTLTVHVELTSQQISDPQLTTAQFAFRRAATLLAQAEDFIVFSGLNRAMGGVQVAPGVSSGLPIGVNVTGGPIDVWGLVEYGELTANAVLGSTSARPLPKFPPVPRGILVRGPLGVPATGADVPQAIARLVGLLEQRGFYGPYACVLDNELYTMVQESNAASLTVPADRIKPILGGPLLRSAQMPPYHGVVISLANEVVDLVVATAPRVQFLQITQNARFLFRVYERFVLRIKETGLSSGRVRSSAITFTS